MPAIPERLQAALADRYRLKREVGQGGMATVYLAQDLKHNRRVALKVLALIDPSGDNLRVLTTTAGDESAPQWTPDGTALVFTSIDGDCRLVTVRVERLLTAP